MEKESLYSGESREKIKRCLEDYSNEFTALNIMMMSGDGIESVRKSLKEGYRLPIVEEYLKKYREEGRDTISPEEEATEDFRERAAILNKLANEINSTGENITEERVRNIVNEALEVSRT